MFLYILELIFSGEPTTSAGQVKGSQGRQVSTDRNQNKKKKKVVSYKEKSTDDEDSDFQPTPIRTPAKKKGTETGFFNTGRWNN